MAIPETEKYCKKKTVSGRMGTTNESSDYLIKHNFQQAKYRHNIVISVISSFAFSILSFLWETVSNFIVAL